MSDVTPPENTVHPHSETQKSSSNFLMSVGRNIPAIITAILGLGSIASGVGYMLVNNYLANFTDIQGFTIHPSQYVVAGLFPIGWGIFLTTVLLIPLFIFNLALKYTSSLPKKITPTVSSQSDNESDQDIQKQSNLVRGSIDMLYKLSLFVFRDFFRIYWIGIALVLFGSVVFSSFSTDIYSRIPRQGGGGQPSAIVLVFKDAESIRHLGLTPNINDPNRADTLLFLAELTEGVLVMDTTNGQVSAVQNDLLMGRMNPAQLYPELLQTFIPTLRPVFISPTPSVTSTPTPTFTPTPMTP